MADVPLVNITINDVPLQVPRGEMVVESAKRLGIEIPIFCYHPRLKPVGMCRMCLIDGGSKMPDGTVRKFPKPQTACTLPATEGLVVYTDTEGLRNDRRGVLEFLLINHPLDCPICDRGGECPLQNNTLAYGPSTSRFVEFKRHAKKAFPLSQYVTLDLERCIQCGRCVRFTEEISGDAQLSMRFRGSDMQPGTFELRNFDSKFSGNVIEICPVGALTNAKYRFRARPWDLQTKPGICTLCSNGCNIYVDHRLDGIARIDGRTNESVNEEWTCDRGKFGHEVFNSDKRLRKPMVRQGVGLAPSDWSAAYEQVLSAFSSGQPVAALSGGDTSNEDLYAMRLLFQRGFASQNLDHRFERVLPSSEWYASANGPTTIPEIEHTKQLLVFGARLADELPILFLRVRKAWFQHGAKVVVASDVPTDVDSFAHVVLRYRPGTGHILADCLLAASGSASGTGLAAFTAGDVEARTGVSAEKLKEAAEIVAGATIITTRSLYDAEGGEATVDGLKTLAKVTGGHFNCYARRANEEGAALLGVLPGPGAMHTHEILTACAKGKIKALWLLGVDPFERHHDRRLVQAALENVDFLVYQHHTESEAMHYASVVIPMTAPTEAEGSYTNLERRVQHFPQVLAPKGEAKPAWRVFADLSLRIRVHVPAFNAGELFGRIGAEVPAFAGASYEKLAGEGLVLGQREPAAV